MCCEQEKHEYNSLLISHSILFGAPHTHKLLTLSVSLVKQYVEKHEEKVQFRFVWFGLVCIHSFHSMVLLLVLHFKALKPVSKHRSKIVEIVCYAGANRMADWLASCLVSCLSSLRLLFFLIRTHTHKDTHTHSRRTVYQFKFQCV